MSKAAGKTKASEGTHDTIINQTINETVEIKPSPMLILRKIIDPDTTSEQHPAVRIETIAVRADAIDLIEPDEYNSSYAYLEQPHDESMRYSRTLNEIRAYLSNRIYWQPVATSPCVRVWICGGPDYLVKGTVEDLNDRIASLARKLD